MLQRLSRELAHVRSGNTSENVPDEICQIIHYLHRAKEITEKVYNNVINSIKL